MKLCINYIMEEEFVMTWDWMESYYEGLSHLKNKDKIVQLIREMRKKGFDKKMRAGQSLNDLVLSRSIKHGLREDQKGIRFSFEYIQSTMEINRRGYKKIVLDEIIYNEIIEEVLLELENEKID